MSGFFVLGCWCKGNTALSKRADESSILSQPAKCAQSIKVMQQTFNL